MTRILSFNYSKTKVQLGFTLLELLVVLSIIALGVGLIIPNLSTTDNSAFNAEIRKASAILNFARRTALVNSTPTVVQFRNLPLDYVEAEEIDTQLVPTRSTWQNESFALSFQDEFQAEPEPVSAQEFIFYPQGGSTGGTIVFMRNARQAMIRVNPITGRISTAYNGEELEDVF